ncbi:MAG: methyltransferase [Phycisphaerales bacterium]|nr:MAG: methyltransferase [Phycisphaerales bacterium]
MSTLAPAFSSDADLAAFREVLARADYSISGVCKAVNVPDFETLRRTAPPLLSARTSAGRPIDILIKLFILGETLHAAHVDEGLAPLSAKVLADAGLLVLQDFPGQGVAAAAKVTVMPYQDLVLAYSARLQHGPAANDFVMGPGMTSRALACQMLTHRRARTLDVGTGCGVLALLAAKHSDHVVGTDLSPHAIAFARFNAKLNAITNVEFRQGSLFEPVAGESFDHILCNPPFVITPKAGYMYRDSGMAGDAMTETVIRKAPQHLSEGGFAQIIGNWATLATKPVRDRVVDWLRGSNCDALILNSKVQNALEYATSWIEESEPVPPDQRWRVLQEWLKSFQDLGIIGITYGTATLRKRSSSAAPGTPGGNWISADDMPEVVDRAVGEHLARIFAGRHVLAGMGAEAEKRLADAVLRPSPDLRLETILGPGTSENGSTGSEDGGWTQVSTALKLANGFPIRQEVDANQAAFVLSLDGRRSVMSILTSLAGDRTGAIAPMATRLGGWLVEKGLAEVI